MLLEDGLSDLLSGLQYTSREVAAVVKSQRPRNEEDQ